MGYCQAVKKSPDCNHLNFAAQKLINDMNESTHKNPNGAGECQCHCDYTLAFLLLRGWLAVRGIFTGIEKFGAYRSIQKPLLDATGQPDASGAVVDVKVKFYSLANYSGIPAGLKGKFANEALLPAFAMNLFDQLLGPALIATGVMLLLGCLHPPGGAVALTAVLGGPAIHQAGYWFALSPVAVNSALLTLVAVLFNNLTGRRYPHRPPPPAAARLDPAGGSGLGIVPADLKAVLDDYGEIVNLTPDDLEDLLHQAQIRAFTRRSGEVTCGEIMSRDVVRVAPSTGLRQAWLILLEARIKALPVVTEAQGLVGIVTQSDFMRAAVLDEDRRIALSLSGRLRHAFGFEARAPLTVADIMTTRVQSALASTRIASIVPPMADTGLHHMPVVDADNRVIGLVTQSDLIAALFRRRLDGGP